MGPLTQRASHMTVIDNRIGFNVAPAYNGALETKILGRADEINVFGESAIPDCPQNGKLGKSMCWTFEKSGMMLTSIFDAGKSIHPIKRSPMPYHGFMPGGSFNGEFRFNKFKFTDFTTKTRKQSPQRMIEAYLQPDIHQPVFFKGTTFLNSEAGAMATFPTPPSSWAIIKDCG